MMIINEVITNVIIMGVCAKAIAKLRVTPVITPVITIVITINGPDHLSDLKAVDDSIFLSESKCYSIFLHHSIHHSVRCNTNQLILYKIYKDNHLFMCVYLMINFVLDSSTYACHQKDSKLAYLVSEQLSCEHFF